MRKTLSFVAAALCAIFTGATPSAVAAEALVLTPNPQKDE